MECNLHVLIDTSAEKKHLSTNLSNSLLNDTGCLGTTTELEKSPGFLTL